MKVEFTLDKVKEVEGKDFVYRTGLVFRAGEYKDKDFSMTPEEMVIAESEFKPAPLDIEHIPTILDGKLGTLEAVKLSDDAEEMYGTAKLPLWLHKAIGDDPVKVSCTFDKQNKTISKLALVRNPRVSDAAMMAAFSESRLDTEKPEKVLKDFFASFADDYDHDKTYSGQGQIQRVHDIACQAGAVCDEKNKESKSYSYFASKKENKAIQSIHDMAVSAGAGCDFKRIYKSNFSKNEVNRMSLKDKLKALFTEVEAELGEESGANASDNTEVAKLKAEIATLTAEKEAKKANTEFASLQAQVEALRAEKLVSEASVFVKEQIKKGVILPAQEAAVFALYTQIANDDSANKAEVGFKVGEKESKVSRLEAFKTIFANGKSVVTEEKLAGSVVLSDEADFAGEDSIKLATEQAKAYAASRNKK